eukprot:757246-Hanusia_phi.AAC.2
MRQASGRRGRRGRRRRRERGSSRRSNVDAPGHGGGEGDQVAWNTETMADSDSELLPSSLQQACACLTRSISSGFSSAEGMPSAGPSRLQS